MKHTVRVTAFVKTLEKRIIAITDEELAEFRSGACEARIAEAFWNDEGKLDGFETVGISGESWELVAAPEPAIVKRWYFSVIDFDDREEYVDGLGRAIARDDAVEFVGTDSEASAESKRRSDLWEEINDCCCAEVVRHSMGGAT